MAQLRDPLDCMAVALGLAPAGHATAETRVGKGGLGEGGAGKNRLRAVSPRQLRNGPFDDVPLGRGLRQPQNAAFLFAGGSIENDAREAAGLPPALQAVEGRADGPP